MNDHLSHLAEFQAILENPKQPYRPSKENQAIIRAAAIALFVGPSNSGRNTTIKKMLATSDHYYYMVSDTTRRPQHRDGGMEQNGDSYWFRSEEDVLADLEAGAYVEAAVIHGMQVSGSSVREVARAHEQGKVAISDFEMAGVDSYLAIKPDTMVLFFLTRNLEEQLHRMDSRGGLTPETKMKRLRTAVKEYQHALDNPAYWFVISDGLDETAAYADELIRTRQPNPQKQAEGRLLTEQLLADTKRYLTEQQG